MAWLVTATITKRARYQDGKGAASRQITLVFKDEPTAHRKAMELVLPDTPYAYATVEEVPDEVTG